MEGTRLVQIPAASLPVTDTGGDYSVLDDDGDLLVAGDFYGSSRDGWSVPDGRFSAYLARWSPSLAVGPRQPLTDLPVLCREGSGVQLGLENAQCLVRGEGTISFAWMHNGRAVSDGPGGASPGGGFVSGSDQCTLNIAGARPSDAGVYERLVTDLCGQSVSVPMRVYVFPLCEPDYTRDGNADADDIAALIDDIAAGLQRHWPSDPDINGDRSADQDDVRALIGLVSGDNCGD